MARRKSAPAALDQLRQDMADERGKARDAGVALDAAKVKVDECGRAVTDAYALEDGKLAAQRRKELRAAEAAVIDLQHRVDAAQLRVSVRSRSSTCSNATAPAISSPSARRRPAPSRPN